MRKRSAGFLTCQSKMVFWAFDLGITARLTFTVLLLNSLICPAASGSAWELPSDRQRADRSSILLSGLRTTYPDRSIDATRLLFCSMRPLHKQLLGGIGAITARAYFVGDGLPGTHQKTLSDVTDQQHFSIGLRHLPHLGDGAAHLSWEMALFFDKRMDQAFIGPAMSVAATVDHDDLPWSLRLWPTDDAITRLGVDVWKPYDFQALVASNALRSNETQWFIWPWITQLWARPHGLYGELGWPIHGVMGWRFPSRQHRIDGGYLTRRPAMAREVTVDRPIRTNEWSKHQQGEGQLFVRWRGVVAEEVDIHLSIAWGIDGSPEVLQELANLGKVVTAGSAVEIGLVHRVASP